MCLSIRLRVAVFTMGRLILKQRVQASGFTDWAQW